MLILDRDSIPPRANYCDGDVAYVLHYLSDKEFASRAELSRYLFLGEGSFRGLLSIMAGAGLVGIHQKGIFITESGHKMRRILEITPMDMDPGISYGPYTQCLRVRGKGADIEKRTELVKVCTDNGGAGCAIWYVRKGQIHMPSFLEMTRENSDGSERIMEDAALYEDDVFLACGARTMRDAKKAAMAVALKIV